MHRSPLVARISRCRRNAITRYCNRAAIFSRLTEARKPDACGGATEHATLTVTREPMESFDMSHPKDQIDNSRTKPLQMEHDGQMSSDRSQSDVRLENCETQARRILPNSLIANPRGRVTLLRLSRPSKEMPSTIRRSPASSPSSATRGADARRYLARRGKALFGRHRACSH